MEPADRFLDRRILEGQYHITKKIGTGGMGAVYHAIQVAMNRAVAIKILHPKLANRKDLASRFRREARAMSQLTHPNTVKVFTYGELDEEDSKGSLYIVMEYLEGRNLNRAVKREGIFTVDRACSVLIQVCGALQEAHDMGIVHRDLKPENIFLCRQGGFTDYPKVLDFGLAKVTERQMRPGSIQLTQEGMVFGTPEFMSPEQAQGKTLDARSDIYSLAVILYEAVTGKLPFEAKTPMEYIQKHVIAPPIPLVDRAPDREFPEGLWETLAKAMAKSPDGRFQTAIEFAMALRPFAGSFAASLDGIFQMSPLPPSTGVPSSLAAHVRDTGAANSAPGASAARGNVNKTPASVRKPDSQRKPDAHRKPEPSPVVPTRVDPPVKRQSLGVLLGVAVIFLLLGAGLAVGVLSWLAK
jgi:eukaryotic-like serine/threonine-protein kinase